jgi:hypothetical protein
MSNNDITFEEAERIFNKIYEEAKNDPNILGFILGGSRGKGIVTKYSDYDIYLVVKDEALNSYKKKYQNVHIGDLWVTSLSFFEDYATIGSPDEGDRYNFTHLNVLIDRNDRIQKLVDEKGRIPEEKVHEYVSRVLDGYINYVYRSVKCFRDHNLVGARLEAVRSVHLFLKVIFGVEGRITPYYKYLEWELQKFPLTLFPMASKDIIEYLLAILETADITIQQELLKTMERVCRKEGYGYVFDQWGSDLKWMSTYQVTISGS